MAETETWGTNPWDTRPWDAADHLRTEEEVEMYLALALEEGDPLLIAEARDVAVRARRRIRARAGSDPAQPAKAAGHATAAAV